MTRIPLTLAAVTLAVALAGCSSPSAPAPVPSPPTSSAPAASPSPSTSKVTVNVADLVDDPAARTTLLALLAASAAKADTTGLVVVSDSTTRPLTGVYDPARAQAKSSAYYDATTKTSQFLPVDVIKAAKAPLALGDFYTLAEMPGMKVAAPAGSGKWLIVLTSGTTIVVVAKDGLVASSSIETSNTSGAEKLTFTYALDAAAKTILDTAQKAGNLYTPNK